ncbi:MAG TPA: hypothetical protein DD400_04605 [Rhodospirillaceae bacterium]|nr:hypothetical protein [Rhodospirillaceae bacterium]
MIINFDGHFSKEDLHSTLNGLGEDILFVQIGAMDGVSCDPVNPFISKLGWHGVLVEPITNPFERLKKNYKDNENLRFVCAAVADFDGQIEMSSVDPEKMPEGVNKDNVFAFSTLMPDRGILGGKSKLPPELVNHFNATKVTRDVPCFTLETLFAREKIEKLDLFVIDTEGADWMVLRQLSLKQYHPRVIYFEYNHISSYEQIASVQHLKNYGYRVFIDETEENVLAVK